MHRGVSHIDENTCSYTYIELKASADTGDFRLTITQEATGIRVVEFV